MPLTPLPLGLHETRSRQAQHQFPRAERLHDPVAALDLTFGTLLDVVGTELGNLPWECRKRQRRIIPFGADHVAVQNVLEPFF